MHPPQHQPPRLHAHHFRLKRREVPRNLVGIHELAAIKQVDQQDVSGRGFARAVAADQMATGFDESSSRCCLARRCRARKSSAGQQLPQPVPEPRPGIRNVVYWQFAQQFARLEHILADYPDAIAAVQLIGVFVGVRFYSLRR